MFVLVVLLTTVSSLSVEASDTGNFPRFVVEPKSAFARRGDSVTLACDVGRDGYDVTAWLHDGVPVTSSRHVTVEGGTLRIASFAHGARTSHEGAYQCVASGDNGSFLSRPAKLQRAALESYPDSLPNSNVTVIAGNVAVIPCAAAVRSVPAAITQFEFNKYRLRLTARHRVLPSGSLQIEAASSSDEGVYRCIAVNPVSLDRLPATNTVTLNVLSAPAADVQVAPRFTWTPLTMVEAIRSETLTLECVAEGWPVPSVTWQRHGGHLPPGRHRFVLGNLVISNVQKEDGGTYVCRADNNSGQPLANVAFVEVIEPPMIVSAPSDRNATVGSSVQFDCPAQGTQPLTIVWFRNAARLVPDQRIRIINSSLHVIGVRRHDAGFYQCLVNNSLDSALATTQLHVAGFDKTPGDGWQSTSRPASRRKPPTSSVPQPDRDYSNVGEDGDEENVDDEDEDYEDGTHGGLSPSGVVGGSQGNMVPPPRPTITKLSETSVRLDWSGLPSTGLPVMFLKVQYRETSDMREGRRRAGAGWRTVDDDIQPHLRSYVMSELRPGGVYQFRLVAVYSNNDNLHGQNSEKLSLPSSPVLESRVPLAAPFIVEVQAVSATAFAISWQYFPSERGGAVDGFYIYHRPYTSTVEYRRSLAPGGATARRVTLTGLAPDTVYSIRMRSFNAHGTSELSNTVAKKTLTLQSSGGRSTSYSDQAQGSDFEPLTPPPFGVGDHDSLSQRHAAAAAAERNNVLFIALGVALGFVVVVLAVVVAMCAWRQRQQRRLLAALRVGGGAAFYESKANNSQLSAKLERPLVDKTAERPLVTTADNNKCSNGFGFVRDCENTLHGTNCNKNASPIGRSSMCNGSWNRSRTDSTEADSNTLVSTQLVPVHMQTSPTATTHSSPLWSRPINADNYRLDVGLRGPVGPTGSPQRMHNYHQPIRYTDGLAH